MTSGHLELFGNGLQLLVVDDDAGIRQLLVAFFRRYGFQLREAANGREALEAMHAGNVDLVIMDLMMPEVSGWDVLRERERDPSLQRIPMLVISALSEATEDIVGKQVAAVLTKPFDLSALLAAVRTSLAHPDVPKPVAA
jgi:DNA-binding response OmpR family regulator